MQQVTPAIRSANLSDCPALADLLGRAYEGQTASSEDEKNELDAGSVAQRLSHGRFLIADTEGGAAGTVYVQLDGSVGRIELLAVQPELQRLGIGRRLLDVAELLCRAEGCSVAQLSMRSEDPQLRRICQRVGYVATAGAPETTVLEKPLTVADCEQSLGNQA